MEWLFGCLHYLFLSKGYPFNREIVILPKMVINYNRYFLVGEIKIICSLTHAHNN